MFYNLTCGLTVSACTEVEADTLEAALEIANNRHVAGIILQSEPDNAWCCDELDGEFMDIKEE